MIYEISYKILVGPKPLHIKFDKVGGFCRIYDKTTFLTLFGSEKYDARYNRIRYSRSLKSSTICIFSNHHVKIKVDPYDSLPIEKTLTFIML